jgi:hypothetical protein
MWQTTSKTLLFSVVTLSLSIALAPASYALASTNSTQDGQIVQSGTYYNTPDSMTTFQNNAKTGLWVQAGSTVRGLEVNSSGALTNNGGALLFNAPGQVVRIDGDINVRGLQNGSGAYIGDGGKVFVNSSYLFQNGNIFANGVNGGLVQFDVGAATIGNGARIMANGNGGTGGTIAINASGPVDIGKQTLLSATGKVLGTIDGNVISIEGSLINLGGTLNADGVNSRGGTIRLVSSGQTNLNQTLNAIAEGKNTGIFTEQEASALSGSATVFSDLLTGKVRITRADGQNPRAIVSASGTGTEVTSGNNPTDPAVRAADGGTIIITANRDIDNGGLIIANGAPGTPPPTSLDPSALRNGGDGGTISLNAGTNISNTGRIVADGGVGGLSIDLFNGLRGGSGGLVAMNYKTMLNTAAIRAMGGNGGFSFNNGGNGGHGGLVVFSGENNAVSTGIVATFGGEPGAHGEGFLPGCYGKLGTIVTPNPTTASNQLFGVWRTTQAAELLTHAENLLLLTRNGGSGTPAVNLFDRMLAAQKRSVLDPTGSLGNAQAEIISKNSPGSAYQFRNLILSSTRDALALNMTHPYRVEAPGAPGELIFPSPLSNGEAFTGLNTLNILNNGSVTTQFLPGMYNDSSYEPTNFWVIGRNSNPMGGSRISALTTGSFMNLNRLGTTGQLSGGSIHIAADGDIINSAQMSTGSNLHGGSILLKAGNDVVNDEQIYYAVGEIHANGGSTGGRIGIFAQNNFQYIPGIYDTAIEANGSLQGGIIEVNAGNNNVVQPSSIADAIPVIRANGTSPTLGRGGFVSIKAGNANIHNAVIEATGGLEDGTVVIEP